MEGSSGASEIPRETERLLVTSGAESSEWIAAGGKRGVSDARVPDTTSGSEMQEEEGTWSYPKEQEDFLEGFLAERRKEVKLYARMHGVSDVVAAQLIVRGRSAGDHGSGSCPR